VKHIKRILSLAIILLLLPCFPANAIESTAYTYALSLNHETYIRIQDAYMPGGTTLSDIGLNAPEDLCYHDGYFYIADTGNGRIVRCDRSNGMLFHLGIGELKRPTGVAVANDGRVFVADYGAEQIVVLSPEGKVLQRIGRPEDLFYGKSRYMPRKVDVDSYGNILAISEGTHEGLLQFMPDGTFAGFFGANKTKGLSLIEWVQKTFFTEAQKAKLFFRNPPCTVSLHVSGNNVYTVIQNDWRNSLKKLNLAGVDILPNAGNVWGKDNYVDLTVAPNGNIIAVTDTGSIEEFNGDGDTLFMFGGRAVSSDRNGLTAVVSSIAVDETYTIYVLDKERALIQAFIPTAFASMLHEAGEDFNAGRYAQSLSAWESILRMNPMTSMAHTGYAATLFQLGEYERAAHHYRLNGQASLYSKCFWEMRSAWLRANMYTILLGGIGVFLLLIIVSCVRKSRDFLSPIRTRWIKAKQKHKLLRDIICEPFNMIRHPIDCLYDLKHKKRGSPISAGILYLLALAVCFLSRMSTSFVFGGGIGRWVDPGMLLITTTVPAALFWIGSYLVSSIHDGEGTVIQAFTSFGYALTPYIVFTPILTILSHALTQREQFIFQFLSFLVIGYTCVLVILSVKETYGYDGRQTVSNLLLTAGFMLIAALAIIILFILWRQLLSFISEIFEEVRYRVMQ